ncbi:hypothetical protein ASPWEDRAFT_49947 [Aspergillus wentii DTO 134E9]|uniref:UEV domain-containing protein n=1 Tax=Aspergillus wentii DTO 134E9 TaxID=1073089 RepID=A0A1L9RND3_ASPWE|nr:uncharacterized protein ASPWEDRAFT_49947 [Aspergillus wentii DTO 134E9]OJJ36455.1 hypothetical protein ASPWEDRAFT_49947 [Aspergillus wentii DTO 134E9]
MAAVPQRTLNWLYGILTRDHYDPNQTYQDPNRTYYDVASALAQYPSLSPRTDVYTFETGFSALLLHITGTLPVSFRGTIYKFPIALWIPSTYPREPPIVYVTPTQDMAVRVGQHVTLEGRVYHHYLAHWAEAWDRSTIVDFLYILREVFAKEPPVRAKQQPMQTPPQPNQMQAPPPRPPLPPELGPRVASPSVAQGVAPPQPTAQTPPQPPPKPGQMVSAGQHTPPSGRYDSPPLLPPLPPKEHDPRRLSFQPHANAGVPADRASQYPPARIGSLDGTRGPYQAVQPQQHTAQPVPTYPPGPAYPQGSSDTPGTPLPQNVPQGPPHQPPQGLPFQQIPRHYSGIQQAPSQHQQIPHQAQQVPQQLQHHQSQQAVPNAQPVPAPKTNAPDLLTSPFELELPSFAPSGPAPPIPPNPEKYALLHAVSKTLAETLQSNVSQSEAAAQSLLSQSQSLHATVATLQGEISSLNTLNSTLQSNSSVLQQSLHRADGVIADAQARISSPAPGSSTMEVTPTGLPPIDEVLVAPTVVGKQLYDLVAEENGIQQAIYALQVALVKGVIGVDTWSRHTRGLAREAFLKRALIRKIGKGMALEES